MVRILRPLRLINRNEGLKIAVSTLAHVFPNVFNIMIVSFIFYLIFGIFVVTFKKGTFYHCENYYSFDGIIYKHDCLNQGGEWVNTYMNFDNIMNAIILLFAMSMTNYTARMRQMVDARGINLEP